MSSPIFGFSHSEEVTVALTLAGGFAVLGVAKDSPEHISRIIERVRERVGGRRFGVDLMFPKLAGNETSARETYRRTPAGHRLFVENLAKSHGVPAATKPSFFTHQVRNQELFEAQTAAVIDSSVDLLACGVGVPEHVVAAAKKKGKVTAALIGSPKHARAALATGVDILVAQGSDAGGHTGSIGTFTLVPQVIELAGCTPVLLAGGVGHGSQVAAALAMGAQGVWLGTIWLATHEHALHPALVEQLLQAGSDDTVISRSHSGKPCRLLDGAWARAWSSKDAPEPLPMPYQQALTGPLIAGVEEHGITSLMYTPAGQSVAWCRERTSVAEVVARLRSETGAALAALQSQTQMQ